MEKLNETDTLTPEIEDNQTELANTLVNYVVNEIHGKKLSRETVIDDLVAKGLQSDSATELVDNVMQGLYDAKKEQARKDMLQGGLWCLGGLAITAVTYSMASGGGSYVVTWGAIIFGGIQFFKGLANSGA